MSWAQFCWWNFMALLITNTMHHQISTLRKRDGEIEPRRQFYQHSLAVFAYTNTLLLNCYFIIFICPTLILGTTVTLIFFLLFSCPLYALCQNIENKSTGKKADFVKLHVKCWWYYLHMGLSWTICWCEKMPM